MTTEVPTAPRYRRICPGVVETADEYGAVYTIERMGGTYNGRKFVDWLVRCSNTDRPVITCCESMRDALREVEDAYEKDGFLFSEKVLDGGSGRC